MDHNQNPNDREKKTDAFYINFENGLGEANELKEKKVDDFFDRLENSKRSRIKDSPRRSEGQRFVTKDGEVLVYRSDEKDGFSYKATETGKRPAAVGNDRKGVRRQTDSSRSGKSARAKNKTGVPKASDQQSGNSASAGSGRNPQKPLKPAKKKSAAVKVIGIIYGVIWRMILSLICLGVIAGCAVTVLGVVYLVNVTKDDEKILNLNNIELSYASMLMVKETDENGEEHWEEYQRIFGGENRVWVKYNDMPEMLINAIVASEDQRFWEHSGVDWKRTIAAFADAYVPGVDLFSTTQGGSTIAQQLIKNVTQEDETEGFDGALRKMREIYRAIMMEKEYSREQILESYLNTFRLSGQVAGIEAAANYYFDKSTGELTVAECAAIVCITKAPGAYNPYIYPDANRVQRDTIINQMREQGYLDIPQWNFAKMESARMVFDRPTDIYTGTNIYTSFADMVLEEVLSDFVNYGFKGCTTKEQAFSVLSRGGYRIYMTLDPFVQERMDDVRLNGRQEEDDERSQYPRQDDGYCYPIYKSRPVKDEDDNYVLDSDGNRVMDDTQPQSAFVVMGMNGEIKGVVGGLGEKNESLSFNRVTMGKRPTGSSMKPLAAYGPAIEANAIHFSSLFFDDPIPNGTVPGIRDWPRNYDRTYGPPVTVAAGIARSLNTTAVWTIHMISPRFAFDYMKSFLGMESLNDPNDVTYSLALGGLYEGVTPLEMCAAFATFGNGGYYYTPHSYLYILDAQGEVVFDKAAYVQKIKAFGDDTAYIMNRLLYTVMHPGFSGTGINACPSDHLDYVGKSGTHTDNQDYWFVGMNPYYVMSVWQGYEPQDAMESPRPHPVQLVFRKVMTEISTDLEPLDFPVPETGVRSAQFCMASGNLASGECSDTRRGYYKDGNMPSVCNHANAPDPNDPMYAWPRPVPVPPG